MSEDNHEYNGKPNSAKALAQEKWPYKDFSWDVGLQKHSNMLMDCMRFAFTQGYTAALSNSLPLEVGEKLAEALEACMHELFEESKPFACQTLITDALASFQSLQNTTKNG